jgi:excisionase family DNA binding protein
MGPAVPSADARRTRFPAEPLPKTDRGSAGKSIKEIGLHPESGVSVPTSQPHAPHADRVLVDDEWMSTAEAARRLGVRPRTVYGFINRGELPAFRIGRVIRVRESDLAAFIESCRIAPGTLCATSKGHSAGTYR